MIKAMVTAVVSIGMITTVNEPVESKDFDKYLKEIQHTYIEDKENRLELVVNKIKRITEQRAKDTKLQEKITMLESELDKMGINPQDIENALEGGNLANNNRIGNIQGINDDGLVNKGSTGRLRANGISLEEFVRTIPVTYFGDSLVAGSKGIFKQTFTRSNSLGVVSMQIAPEGQNRLNDMLRQGLVQPYIVIMLGTNRGLTQRELETMVQSLGNREIFFVNTISYVDHRYSVDREITTISNKYSNVHRIDFLSHEQPQFFAGDGIHHSVEGMRYLVDLIARTMYNTYY